jgi:diguanylate cyclase (GGDEF)-like protein
VRAEQEGTVTSDHPATAFDALARSAGALARGVELETQASRILQEAIDATGALRASAATLADEAMGLEVVAAVGDGRAPAGAGSGNGTADPALADAARTRAAAWGRTDAADPSVLHADLPLVVSRGGIERAVGAVSFTWSSPHEASDEERQFLSAVADLLAVAIDGSFLASMAHERAEWLERLSQADPLTGLANGRTLARMLELEVARAGRQGGRVSVAVFDVDDFAAINERDGQEAGDAVLREVAAIIGGAVRLVDTVARTGADEFVVVAPGSAGATVASRIAEAVAASDGHGGPAVTVSTGVAHFPDDATTPDDLLAVARAGLDGSADPAVAAT